MDRVRATAVIIFIILAFACSDNADIKLGSIKDVSPFVQTFLGLNTVANISLYSSRGASPNQAPSAGQYTVGYASVPKPTTLSSDSTVVIDYGQACGHITETYHPDGSITMITDITDTCTQIYNGAVTRNWGKYTNSWRNTATRAGSLYNTDYFYSGTTVNLGSSYVSATDTSISVSNGVYLSKGVSSYDTITQAYTSSSTWSDTSQYVYNKTTYSYLSFGQYTFSDNKSVVLKSEYNYRNGADYYETTITIPLVRDFGCQVYASTPSMLNSIAVVMIPVSGHEVVKYSQGGVEGTFEIDYGNGHCDAFVEIIENGKSTMLDLGRPFPMTY